MEGERTPRLGHQPTLDGLRALAVLAVMLFHGDVSWAVGGYLGVDAFFVLSGFLITTLLLSEWLRNRSGPEARGRIDLVDFYRRRLRRLLPALLLMLLGVAAFAAFVARTSDLASIRADALATLAYVGNWHQLSAPHGYFAQFASPSPLQHTWSLAVEEQWYLVWPLVIVALLRLRLQLRHLLGLVIALALGSAVLMAVLAGSAHDTSRVYYGTDTRAQELLVGAALAVIFVQWGYLRSRAARVACHAAAAVAVVVLAVAWTRVDGSSTWLYRGGFLVLAVCVGLVVLSAVQPDRTPLRWILSWRTLGWIGAISYGLYLWHWPVYVWLTSARTGVSNATVLLGIRFAVTFAIAAASYYLVEMPIRQQRFRLPSMRFLAPSLTAAVALVVLLVSARATPSTASALSHLERVAARADAPPPTTVGGTPTPLPIVTAGPPITSAAQSGLPVATPGRAPRIFVTGDSVATSLAVGLADVAGPQASVWNHGAFGCGLVDVPFVADDDPGVTDHCVRARATWIDDARSWRPDVVVLLSAVWDTFDRELPTGVVRFGTPEFDSWYVDQLHALVDEFSADGARVVLLTAPCADPSAAGFGETGGLWASFDASRVPALNGLFAQAAQTEPGELTMIDLDRVACPDGQPVEQIEGQATRLDGVHFSTAGADWIARWLLPKLVRTG